MFCHLQLNWIMSASAACKLFQVLHQAMGRMTENAIYCKAGKEESAWLLLAQVKVKSKGGGGWGGGVEGVGKQYCLALHRHCVFSEYGCSGI